MKKINCIALACAILLIAVTHSIVYLKTNNHNTKDKIKVGFIYVGDGCNAYTKNFMKSQEAIALEYGSSVETVAKYNVAEGNEEKYLVELINEGCDLIFGTSYGYQNTFKEYAAKNPDIEFCMATGDNANTDETLPNYHNFMGEIYEGRYITGVVAGMKMKELITEGELKVSEAKVGYVAAFPYSEVISGYTAFYLGVQSIIPEATMTVIYSNSWNDYDEEKKIATQLINEGCVVISQHSDTAGPAVACEEASAKRHVYHVGYNQSMSDIAPTTSLISSRVNWQKYMVAATGAVLEGKSIEKAVKGNVHGKDISGGFAYGWVEMLRLNDTIAAEGTSEKITSLINGFKKGNINVFKGNFVGVDPFDSSDTYDLSKGFKENENSSSPKFHYVLKNVITIEDVAN